jgi:Leucine-rich repeat (LRR) protein
VGIDTILTLGKLEELNLAGTRITDVGLAKLADLPNLRVLDLSGTQVTAAGLEQLTAAKKLHRLAVWNAPKVAPEALEKLRISVRHID